MSKITLLSRTPIIVSVVIISLVISGSFVGCKYVTKKPQCSLTIEQAPNINGINLGMTREELKELLSNVSLPSGEKVSVDGNLSPKLMGIEKIDLYFKDNRVNSFEVNYKNKGWRNLNEFIDEMLVKLNLPYAQNEPLESDNDSLKFSVVSCKDFSVYVGGSDFGGGLKRIFTVSLRDSRVQK